MTRGELLRAYARAVGSHDLARRVRDELRDERGPARVLAVGKAASAMALGALAALGGAAEELLVVLPDGAPVSLLRRKAKAASARLRVRRAAHPLPDARSVRAAEACLAFAERPREGTLYVLVSGGASSLVTLPAPGVSLADTRAVTRALLHAGLDVRAVNAVRVHLSAIKGGRLLAAARRGGALVVSLVASDVVGGAARDVGSGPSVPTSDRRAEARATLRAHAPKLASLPLSPVPRGRRADTRLVASPESFAEAVAEQLRLRGLEVTVLPSSTADVERLARSYVRLAASARPRTAFVRAAEPRVEVAARRGRGGRNAHLAALVGAGLVRPATFAALATDGVDGDGDTAGAVVDERFRGRVARQLGPDALARAVTRFDTGPLHRAVGTAVPCTPSGQNFADLHVLVVDELSSRRRA